MRLADVLERTVERPTRARDRCERAVRLGHNTVLLVVRDEGRLALPNVGVQKDLVKMKMRWVLMLALANSQNHKDGDAPG